MKKYFMAQPACAKNGFATLLMVIVAGAAGLVIIFGLSLISMSSSRIANNFYFSQKAKGLADACAMNGLMLVRNNSNYSGSGSLSIDGQSCNYSVANSGGNNREVRGWSTVSNAARKVKINISVSNSQISISSWQELGDF